jgi:hypothetical protein
LPIQFGDLGEDELAAILGGAPTTASATSNNMSGYISNLLQATPVSMDYCVKHTVAGPGKGLQVLRERFLRHIPTTTPFKRERQQLRYTAVYQ